MKIAPFDFTAKAAELKARAAALESDYNTVGRSKWLTLYALQSALSALSKAVSTFSNIPFGSEEGDPMWDFADKEIRSIEDFFAGIDLERVTTDDRYAGSLIVPADLVRKCAESAEKFLNAYVAFAKTKVVVADARKSLQAFNSPEREKAKYAVVKESFRHEKGGTPVQFNIGQHCLIDHESTEGIAVVCCNYGVYFPTAEIANHFDIVEI